MLLAHSTEQEIKTLILFFCILEDIWNILICQRDRAFYIVSSLYKFYWILMASMLCMTNYTCGLFNCSSVKCVFLKIELL